jgi:hypothetical protein
LLVELFAFFVGWWICVVVGAPDTWSTANAARIAIAMVTTFVITNANRILRYICLLLTKNSLAWSRRSRFAAISSCQLPVEFWVHSVDALGIWRIIDESDGEWNCGYSESDQRISPGAGLVACSR